MPYSLETWKHFQIPDHIFLSTDADGLLKISVQTIYSNAEIYFQGAHVTSFQQHGRAPLLFMSASGRMSRGHMLHGGIPLCFPWFGNRPGEELSHGFVRLHPWNLIMTKVNEEEEVELLFEFPEKLLSQFGWLPLEVHYKVIVGASLKLELSVKNRTEESFSYEECFHTYFSVGDIEQTMIQGLQGLYYLDKTEDLILKLENQEKIPIRGEINRIYLDSRDPIQIHDYAHGRIIHIKKNFSRSTVLWNPWIEKATSIPDFAPDDFKQMICVESGNIGQFSKKLSPGESSLIYVELSTSSD